MLGRMKKYLHPSSSVKIGKFFPIVHGKNPWFPAGSPSFSFNSSQAQLAEQIQLRSQAEATWGHWGDSQGDRSHGNFHGEYDDQAADLFGFWATGSFLVILQSSVVSVPTVRQTRGMSWLSRGILRRRTSG